MSKKYGIFNQPLQAKMREVGSNFAAPTKDEAYTDQRFRAGDYYGSGYRNPVAKFRNDPQGDWPLESQTIDLRD